MMGERAGHDRGLAVRGKWKVMGKTGQLTVGCNTDHAESQRKPEETQPQLTRKMNKKMEKGVRRNIMSQTPVWETLEMEGRKMEIRRRAKKEETTTEWTLKQ